jgi:hypothetical protein
VLWVTPRARKPQSASQAATPIPYRLGEGGHSASGLTILEIPPTKGMGWTVGHSGREQGLWSLTSLDGASVFLSLEWENFENQASYVKCRAHSEHLRNVTQHLPPQSHLPQAVQSCLPFLVTPFWCIPEPFCLHCVLSLLFLQIL